MHLSSQHRKSTFNIQKQQQHKMYEKKNIYEKLISKTHFKSCMYIFLFFEFLLANHHLDLPYPRTLHTVHVHVFSVHLYDTHICCQKRLPVIYLRENKKQHQQYIGQYMCRDTLRLRQHIHIE